MTTVEATPTTKAPRVGENAPRPDGVPKVTGQFAFSSDLWADEMLWGQTLRSPYPSARILGIDIGPALAIPGVYAALTAEDVPGRANYGVKFADQPVFAADVVRYAGEPVAVVAADHPDTARRAAEAIDVTYEVLEPVLDPEQSMAGSPLHPDGNVFRHLAIRHGDIDAVGEVQVEGTYEIGMQDQAMMGVESGLAVPAEDGGVDLYISTQWLHNDRDQVAASLGLPDDKVRLTLSGVGGAFGAREDVSIHIHLCMLALHTGKPVKMVYSREESFIGHVHRHPARMWFRHHADRDGKLVKIEARVVLDGGAYVSKSTVVLGNAMTLAAGPYVVPNANLEGWSVRTNNLPAGAMRGLGAVQTCFAGESQMDKLAAALGLHPLELRRRNALAPGDEIVTGQPIPGTAPVRELIDALADHPMPGPPGPELMARPGGAGRTGEPDRISRGVGYGFSIKNICMSEGFDDYSTARCRLEDGVATITCACAEVGQGFVTLAQQIARQVLDIDDVIIEPADTSIGSAGSTSASRQTWMSGGAIEAACQKVLETMREHPGRQVYEEEVEFHHRPSGTLDENGQGSSHVSLAFAAHRAVVDVDLDLGLIRVVQIATAQDVGKVMNPLQAVGQIEGGIAQGVGLAVMEELVRDGGRLKNATFTDYLIPTALDMPDVSIAALIEQPEPGAPFGAKGIGEPPTISSTPAVAAAVRDATGLDLPRVPIRPQDIALAGADQR